MDVTRMNQFLGVVCDAPAGTVCCAEAGFAVEVVADYNMECELVRTRNLARLWRLELKMCETTRRVVLKSVWMLPCTKEIGGMGK